MKYAMLVSAFFLFLFPVPCDAQEDWIKVTLAPQLVPLVTTWYPVYGFPAVEIGAEFGWFGLLALVGKLEFAWPAPDGFIASMTGGIRLYGGEDIGHGFFLGVYPVYRWLLHSVGPLPAPVAELGLPRMFAWGFGSVMRLGAGFGIECYILCACKSYSTGFEAFAFDAGYLLTFTF